MFFVALYLYFRTLAINAASHIDSNFMSQIRDNIKNRIDNAKIATSKSPVARLIEKEFLE
jgi:biopolymer transport protein ExbB